MTIVLNCWELADSNGASVSSLTVSKPVAGSLPQWIGSTWKSSRQWNRRLPSSYYGPSWISGITWKSETAWAWGKFYGEYPKSPEPGDLLIILVGNGSAEDTAQWDDSTLKPTGFTFINEAGAADQDCHCAAFYKIVDGTEGVNFSIPAASADYMWAFCILISAGGPLYIHQTGADCAVANAVSATPLTITGITTTVAKCLGLFVAAYDGADDGGFTCDGTGWIEQAENRSGTDAASASGVFGKKTLTLVGASGDATVYASSGDGMVGFQFAIGEKAVFLATSDDQWLNTVDDFWFGINIVVTALAARIKSRSYKVPRPIYAIPSTVKFPKSKLRATKLPALSAFNIYLKSKFAGIKTRQAKPKALLTRIYTLMAKFAGVKTRQGKPKALLTRIYTLRTKFAGVKLRAKKLPPLWAYIPAIVKFAGVKLRATIPATTILSLMVVTVVNAGIKLSVKKDRLILFISMRIKRAGIKLRAHKLTRWWRALTLTTKRAGVKLGAQRDKLTLRIAMAVKRAGLKLRAARTALSFYLDFFRDTVDDFWVSTWDDEWLGRIVLRIKNARLKLVSHKNKPFIAIPVTANRAGIKLRARKSILSSTFATLQLTVKNARIKFRARKSILSAYMATIALTVKNARLKLRASKPILDFHFLWLTTKNAGVKFHMERFTGWYINIPLKAARLKIVARKTQFSFRLAVRNAGVKLRARKDLLIRRITLTVRRAGIKLRARKDSLTLRLVMAVKRARIKINTRRDILARVVWIIPKRASLRLRTTKSVIAFSLATISLIIRNARSKIRATRSTIGFAEATIALILKNAGTKIRASKSIIRFAWMTPLTVKRAGVKIRAIPANVRTRFFTLVIKPARMKMGATKGRLIRVVTIRAKTAGIKIRSLITDVIKSVIMLSVITSRLKTRSTRTIASSIHTLGTKIARFNIRATTRTISVGTILWRGLIQFVTRALTYRFSTSGDAVVFETKAEVYRFVSKSD